jgi:hypothetical protein
MVLEGNPQLQRRIVRANIHPTTTQTKFINIRLTLNYIFLILKFNLVEIFTFDYNYILIYLYYCTRCPFPLLTSYYMWLTINFSLLQSFTLVKFFWIFT